MASTEAAENDCAEPKDNVDAVSNEESGAVPPNNANYTPSYGPPEGDHVDLRDSESEHVSRRSKFENERVLDKNKSEKRKRRRSSTSPRHSSRKRSKGAKSKRSPKRKSKRRRSPSTSDSESASSSSESSSSSDSTESESDSESDEYDSDNNDELMNRTASRECLETDSQVSGLGISTTRSVDMSGHSKTSTSSSWRLNKSVKRRLEKYLKGLTKSKRVKLAKRYPLPKHREFKSVRTDGFIKKLYKSEGKKIQFYA